MVLSRTATSILASLPSLHSFKVFTHTVPSPPSTIIHQVNSPRHRIHLRPLLHHPSSTYTSFPLLSIFATTMPALYSPAELEAAAGLELLSQATPFLSRCATISGSEAATPEAEAAGPTITVRLNVNQLALESKPKPVSHFHADAFGLYTD